MKLIQKYLGIGLFLLLPCANSWAQQLQVVNQTTDDSSVEIRGDFPPEDHFIHFEIVNQATQATVQNIIPISGSVDTHLYLKGSGNFKVDAWACTGATIFSGGCGAYLGSYALNNRDTVDRDGLLPTAYVQSDNEELITLAQSQILGATSDIEKLQLLHDWVATHTVYDTDAYYSGSWSQKVYDAVTVLHTHMAICDGYSNLFAALARAAGIHTHVVNGYIIWPIMGETWENAGTKHIHSWNQAFVDGRWIDIDVTWDSGAVDFHTRKFVSDLKQEFFNPEVDDFSKTHHFTSVNDH